MEVDFYCRRKSFVCVACFKSVESDTLSKLFGFFRLKDSSYINGFRGVTRKGE